VTWSASGATPTTFVGTLIATPALLEVQSDNRLAPPAGWTSTWAQYTVFVDPDGLGGEVSDGGCSPCTNHVQREASYPPSRSVSSRLAHLTP
jgi:hypothetical protein